MNRRISHLDEITVTCIGLSINQILIQDYRFKIKFRSKLKSAESQLSWTDNEQAGLAWVIFVTALLIQWQKPIQHGKSVDKLVQW